MIIQRNDGQRRPPYPWGVWFRNDTFVLTKGTDYDCHTYAMVQQVRNAARPKRHNVKVSIKVSQDGESIAVRVKWRSSGRKEITGRVSSGI